MEQILHAIDCRDPLKASLDWFSAKLFDLVLIHEAGVEVANLLGSSRLGVLGGLLDKCLHCKLGVISEHVEGAIQRLVGWDFGFVEPLAIDMAEQVILGLNFGLNCR